ncbi:hypothetical protein JZ751_017171 [Albula glossodonta]|uniref:Uncharacterized protein n=1 Tax=Albula glossodonta TaxID=121402 RepID=A0A8T2NSV4_9TELE|nr:hypothetical protein JZ751_017171 [Albula glossodonta]
MWSDVAQTDIMGHMTSLSLKYHLNAKRLAVSSECRQATLEQAFRRRLSAPPQTWGAVFKGTMEDQPPKDPLLQLISLQKASGSWDMGAELAELCGKTTEETAKHMPAQVGVASLYVIHS